MLLHCLTFVRMCKACLCTFKSVKLCAFVRVSVMLYLSVHCVFVCPCTVYVQACMGAWMWFYQTYAFPNGCFTEALYEKKQSMMTYENETSKLQAQVEDLEATSAEKDTLIAKYEATLKESEGEINL